jgi:molecular chaperone GrpE
MPEDIVIPPDTPASAEDRQESHDPGPAGTEESLDTLRAKVEVTAREAAEAHSRHLRTLADFDNYRKRIERERVEWRRQSQEQLVGEILPVLDNFERALAAEPGSGGNEGLRAGVELIHRDFLKALERIGVRPFSALGELFDPQRHEAVARVERGDVADQTVVEETLRGYLFHDRVLRPTQVVVAVEPTPPPEPGEASF